MDFCPRPGCLRAGPDLGSCGEHALGCPRPRPVDPKTEVVIRCSACDRTWAVPVENILKGGTMPKCIGDTAECHAVIVAAPSVPKESTPKGKTGGRGKEQNPT